VRSVLPNLVIAGVSRAGTTSLFNYLLSHPDAAGADVKELRYFTPLRYGGELGPIEEYAAHFRGAGDAKVVFEATPGYFYGGRAIARAVEATLPGARAVVSLRRPEDRCWSWFRFQRSRMRLPKDMSFARYLDRCLELREEGSDGSYENRPFWGLRGGCYAEWLPEWVDELGDRFRVFFFDDLVADSHRLMVSMAEWLGIDPSPFAHDPRFDVHNSPQQYRAKALQTLAVATNRRAEGFFRRHPTLKRGLRAGYYRLNTADFDKAIPRAEQARLREFYRPHNVVLAEQLAALGMRLPTAWDTASAPSEP
jgi:hypothetical protein